MATNSPRPMVSAAVVPTVRQRLLVSCVASNRELTPTRRAITGPRSLSVNVMVSGANSTNPMPIAGQPKIAETA